MGDQLKELLREYFKGFWIYNFEAEYLCHEFNEYTKTKGLVIAKNMDDAYAKIKLYCLNPDDDFEKIHIETRDESVGSFSIDSLVIPFANDETFIKIPENGN